MTYDEIVKIVSNIKYRNLNLLVSKDYGEGGISILLSRKVSDSLNPEEEITQYNTLCLPLISSLNEDWLVKMIFNSIVGMEEHEVSEWFSYKGNKLFYPH